MTRLLLALNIRARGPFVFDRPRDSLAGSEHPMPPRRKRIIHNEALFREVNAHIAELEERISIEGEPLPLICECANTGCITLIKVDQSTFRAVRKNPLRFLVASGHERDGETVVGRGAGYLIVEKEDEG